MLASLMGLCLGVSTALAQDGPETTFSPWIDVRPRAVFNYTDGLSRGFLESTSILERARLGMLLTRGEVSGFVGVQEYRGWGFDEGSGTYARIPPTFEAYEAWGRLQAALPGEVSVQLTAGRQLLSLHRGRLVSDYDFSFRGQPLDALALNLRLADLNVLVVNFRDFSDPSSLDDPGATVLVVGVDRAGPVSRWQLDGVYIVDFFPGSVRNTFGPTASVAIQRWQLDVEAYLQTVDLPRDPDAASLLAAVSTGVALGPERLVTVTGAYALQTASLDGNRRVGFQSPAGDVYEFWGHMNLFARSEDTDHRGLQDLHVTLAPRPHPRLTFEADLHGFWLQRDPTALGAELDLKLRYEASPIGAIEGGYMQFWAARGLAEVTSEQGPFRTGYVDLRVALPESSRAQGRQLRDPR